MKLAIVSLMNGQPWGGSEALWYALAEYALEQRNEVLVSVYEWDTERPQLKLLEKKGASVLYRQKFNNAATLPEKIKRSLLKRVPSLNKNYQSIIDFKPDHIFISQGDSFDLVIHHEPFYELIRKNNIPYSIVCHGHSQYGIIPAEAIWRNGPEIFTNAKNIFFISKRQQQLAERRLLTRLDNAHFTWNPLNMQVPEEPYAMPATDTFSMAIVGGLVEGKGHDTVLEILGGENWKNRNWELNIYGTGIGEEYLKKAASFYNISNKVFFHGFTNDIGGIWKKNHLLLVPSSGEGLPISLAEAMACGRAAVVTDVGGNTELVEEDQTGFIASSPATSSFAAAMEKAWSKKGSAAQMGQNAFDHIRKLLDVSPEVALYKLLLK